MIRTSPAAAALACAAMVVLCAPARAATGTEWYLGLGIGGSNISGAPDVVPVVGATASSIVADERDPGVQVFAGYRFNRHFALEGGYAWLGEFQFTNQVSAPTTGALNADVRVVGLFLDAVGLLPLGRGFTALANVGVIGSETRVFRSTSGTVTPAPDATTNATTDEANLKYGLGLQYDIGRTAAVRVEWDRFSSLGNAATGEFDIDLYSVGVVLRF